MLDAIELHVAAAVSRWDTLIVAAATRLRCDSLLSEAMNDGERIAGVRNVKQLWARPRVRDGRRTVADQAQAKAARRQVSGPLVA